MSADFKNQRQCPDANAAQAINPSQDNAAWQFPLSIPAGATQEEGCQGDCFELLSAYLDGEVTAAERQQVETWLATDPDIQQLHARLLNLRHELQVFGTVQPPASASVDDTVAGVMQRLHRRPRRVARWGGFAVAATVIGAVTLVFSPVGRSPLGQFANSPTPAASEATGLQIALDSPVIEIPSVDSNTSITQ